MVQKKKEIYQINYIAQNLVENLEISLTSNQTPGSQLLTIILEEIYREEEVHWQLRSKQKWLEEDNHNTKYFHTIATHK